MVRWVKVNQREGREDINDAEIKKQREYANNKKNSICKTEMKREKKKQRW